MITFVRYLSARDDICPCLFRNRLTKLLCLAKRLSGVGIADNVLWASGDATPTCIDGVNWANNEYLKIFSWGILQEFTNRRQSSHLIAECELAAVVAIVVSWTGPLLTSRILFNGSDNTNVLRWIRKKKANNRIAFRMLKCLHIWCVKYDIDLYGLMARSMRNVSPDLITRASTPGLEEWEQRLGMRQLVTLDNVKEFASCVPDLADAVMEGEVLDLGLVGNQVEYWWGVIIECDPFAGAVHRWAEENRLRYAVWFTEMSKMATMWRKNCVLYKPGGEMGTICA